MGFFKKITGIGGTKSSHQSNARSFIDPNQAPYLQDIYKRAQTLGTQGMPVEGTAGINPALQTALNNQYRAGGAIGSAGTGIMTAGSELAGGANQALNYATDAITGNLTPALNAGKNFATMGQLIRPLH